MKEIIDRKAKELFSLLAAHRQTDVLQRINLYSLQQTGKKVPDFINNGASYEEKEKLLDTLIGIVKEQAWDKLPKVPNGQAQATPPVVPKPAAAPAPAPAATAPKPAAAPAPKLETPEPKPRVELPTAATSETDAAAELAALITRLAAQTAPKVGQQLTEDDVRRIVRDEMTALVRSELADVLVKISQALVKK